MLFLCISVGNLETLQLTNLQTNLSPAKSINHLRETKICDTRVILRLIHIWKKHIYYVCFPESLRFCASAIGQLQEFTLRDPLTNHMVDTGPKNEPQQNMQSSNVDIYGPIRSIVCISYVYMLYMLYTLIKHHHSHVCLIVINK